MNTQDLLGQLGQMGLLVVLELDRLWKVERESEQMKASAAELFNCLNECLIEAVDELELLRHEYEELRTEVQTTTMSIMKRFKNNGDYQ